MLAEIRCDKFLSSGNIRPPISFGMGLNAVIGTESGSNSIGKSTFLLIVDFTFGGDDYVLKSTDVQTQIGGHTIQFTFEFNGKKYFFSRNTLDHTIVSRCNENYETESEMPIKEYRNLLFELYGIQLPLISFRDIVGRYFRIYGRENLDEKRPLQTAKGESDKAAIIALMKLFDTYAAIADLEKTTEKKKEEKKTYSKAQEFHFVPKITKKQLTDNEKKIQELQSELSELQTNTGNQLLGLDSNQAEIIADIKQRLTTAKRQKSRYISQLNAVKSDMAFENPSIQANFQELLRFFPHVDLKKVEDIERFHAQLVNVLNNEFEETKQRLEATIDLLNGDIARLESEIKASGVPPKISRTTLETYSSKKGEIVSLEKQNAAYEKMDELKTAAKSMENRLAALQEEQIGFLQSEINVKMDKINDYVYSEEKKPPVLTIKKPTSYSFLTPDDTGTGTSYKGLVVFDLSILQLTALPALVHDSVILKQIADEPLEKIVELYSSSKKQVFIALDKKGSYTEQTQKVLDENTVLRLAEGGDELFGRSWNTKDQNNA